MGQSGSVAENSEMRQVGERLENKVGKLAVSGRYHKLPRKPEDDYEFGSKVLGTGLDGAVKIAHSKHLAGEAYAVKTFSTVKLPKDKKSQLMLEITIFLCMDHPHVCRLVDVYDSDTDLRLIMECMEGGELFDRIMEVKRFTESDAANAVYQMLLAVNYLHRQEIVHRDLKLENFLYDKKGSSHLKLIDFGFSKFWDPAMKMQKSCGTLSYVAPEVLNKSYTSQCDLWSLGVLTFILLSGSMPFFESKGGASDSMQKSILAGKYTMKPEKWKNVSDRGKEFTRALLQVNPQVRLTAQQSLDHAWIAKRADIRTASIDSSVVNALKEFGAATKFKRCCMEMMAWSLSNEDRAKVREYFLAMDTTKGGTITLTELKQALEKFNVSTNEVQEIFSQLDTNNDQEIHYSDFLAAMVSQRIGMHEHLLRATFNRFDVDHSGFISKENLREVLGESFEGEKVEELMKEADLLKDGQISYAEFVAYLRGEDVKDDHADAAMQLIDKLKRGESKSPTAAQRPVSPSSARSSQVHRSQECFANTGCALQ